MGMASIKLRAGIDISGPTFFVYRRSLCASLPQYMRLNDPAGKVPLSMAVPASVGPELRTRSAPGVEDRYLVTYLSQTGTQ